MRLLRTTQLGLLITLNETVLEAAKNKAKGALQ
jgi:hypothetical protein